MREWLTERIKFLSYKLEHYRFLNDNYRVGLQKELNALIVKRKLLDGNPNEQPKR